MNKYLPSKRFIYIISSVAVAFLLVIGMRFLINKNFFKNETAVQKKDPVQAGLDSSLEKFLATDTDGDGLKDWEEALWKTDLKIVDTDGDGTIDGEEVAVNRDPLKAGPGDEIDPQIITDNKKETEEFLQLTETDKLSRTLLSQYLASKENGTLSKTNRQIILDTAISIVNDIKHENIYEISSIRTFSDINKETLKNYGNELAVRAANLTEETVTQELAILAEAIVTENEVELEKLNPAINLYGIIIQKYLDLAAPVEVRQVHLNIINDLEIIKRDVADMKLLFKDPLKALMAINNYKTTVTRLQENYTGLNKYFISKGIIFSTLDPGYILFSTVQ